MKLFDRKLLKTALLATVPVMAGYVVLGAAFGMILKTHGYGVGWALAMSLFIYAGSMQYVAIDMLTGGASAAAAAVTALMVNARHLFYGISMVDKYKSAGREKPYLIFALTDETYSLVCSGAPEGVGERGYYLLVSVLDQVYWVLGSVLGSALGAVLHFNTEGIDFALTALFVTVFVEQWKSSSRHLPALIGVGASLACLLLFGADSFLIPAMLLITTLLLLSRKKEAV